MIPWRKLGAETLPQGVELILYERDGEYSIRMNGWELMSSRAHGSEETLAVLICERLSHLHAPRLLIGGLGLGFTLRAALDRLNESAVVTVAELAKSVVEWNRGPLAPLSRSALADPRVRVVESDVSKLLRKARAAYDAVILDVDNGPAALTVPGNAWLYQADGLAAVKRSLAPAGVLAVWSAGPDVKFEKTLRGKGFSVETITVPARGTGGGTEHTLFIARKVTA